MKRLISLISTHGKSPQQSTQEVGQAYQKYSKVEAQVLQKMSQQNPQPQREDDWEVLVRLPQDTDEPKEVFRPKPQKKAQSQPPPMEKTKLSLLPQRLLIPLNLSADKALAAVKKFFSDYQGIKLISK